MNIAEMEKRIFQLVFRYFDILLLAVIIYFAIGMRLPTANTDILLDYDPWWFYRHAKEIIDNGLLPPKWDVLSYYPPGRPVDYQLGWPYTIALSYLVTNIFFPISPKTLSPSFFASLVKASSSSMARRSVVEAEISICVKPRSLNLRRKSSP